MANADIFDTIESLRRSGAPFCVATVVRTADVTSAKAGAKAVVSAGGDIIGHLGGACVQRAVRKAAMDALDIGDTRMIRVKPSEKVASPHDVDGVQLYKSGCPSGGTADILIEPFRSPPRLVVFGDTPISVAVAQHAGLLGLRVTALGNADAVEELDLTADDFVVVASQGVDDLAALRIALTSGAGFVSMVASFKKAEVLKERLAGSGIPPERLAGLKAPAGLAIGGVDAHEIAVSIVAEIVQRRGIARGRRQESET